MGVEQNQVANAVDLPDGLAHLVVQSVEGPSTLQKVRYTVFRVELLAPTQVADWEAELALAGLEEHRGLPMAN